MSSTADDRFKYERTSSNRAGFTLMNNQVGYVVANVMRGKPGVTVEELPSMIRVDGDNKFEIHYAECAEALGWDDFGNDDFEEIMSTHYGRLVGLDARIIMLAHPEAARAHKHPGKLIPNGRWDPREGEAGLKQLEEDAKRYNLQGVKLYTAEWYKGSRGWRLDDEQSKPFLEKCKELGIKNLHVHKGPT